MSEEVLPLYLNLDETRVLVVAVDIMLRLDSSVILNEDVQQMAEEVIRAREGMSGVARADQALAAARERVPILRSLRTALVEHGETLERTHRED
jgi:hypothetical protein